MHHPQHDYSSGGFFITFATFQRAQILGSVIEGEFYTSQAGSVVLNTWQNIPAQYPLVAIDSFQLMPDHVHCILILTSSVDVSQEEAKASLPDVIHWFKGTSSRRVNKLLNWQGPVWGRGYYDRIIRHEQELEKFRSYIATNPMRTSLASP